MIILDMKLVDMNELTKEELIVDVSIGIYGRARFKTREIISDTYHYQFKSLYDCVATLKVADRGALCRDQDSKAYSTT